jgi:CheY-like chemotaxis protein
MDLEMPQMDGMTTTLKIREELNLTDLPIVAVTGYDSEGMKEKCLAIGMNDYLSKPISPDPLYKTLYKFLVYDDTDLIVN